MDNKKTCPVCETPNFLGAKNCEVCGEPLPIPQASAASPAVAAAGAPAPDAAAAAPAPPSSDELRELEKFDALLMDAGGEFAGEASGFVRDHDTIVDRSGPLFDGTSEPATASPDGESADAAEESHDPTPAEPFAFAEAAEAGPASDEPARPPSSGFESAPSTGQVSRPMTATAREVVVSTSPTSGVPLLPTEECARLVVYQNKQPIYDFDIAQDESLIGRRDPTSDSWPDLDLTQWDPDASTSRKHAYIYREGGKYFVYPISNSGTQLGSEMLDIGAKTELNHGDILILGGVIAMMFKLPQE